MTCTTTTTPRTEPCNASAREVCDFLAHYSERLFSSGATCIRLEKNVGRMARAFGVDVELSILPRHIHITVHGDTCGAFTSIVTIRDRPVDFALNAALSQLSWDIADGKIGFQHAHSRFESILRSNRNISKWAELLLVSLANASFCRLFGGDGVAMAIVFAATMAGYATKQLMLEHHADMRLTVLVCSFISAVLASADSLFSLGATPALAIGTSVLYLVPGIPFLNSFSDMLDRHYICAFGRLMNAVVITCCLSAGLCAGMMIMNIGMF